MGRGRRNVLGNRSEEGWADINTGAALEQTSELLAMDEENAEAQRAAARSSREGPSVTYHLKTALTIPSRNDQQLIEVARIEVSPEFFYKAVPVLTPHVYRLATLTNTSDHVLLPGEATMYLNGDFVGQTRMSLVAAGKPFTVGFGVDPQGFVNGRGQGRARVGSHRPPLANPRVAESRQSVSLSGRVAADRAGCRVNRHQLSRGVHRRPGMARAPRLAYRVSSCAGVRSRKLMENRRRRVPP